MIPAYSSPCEKCTRSSCNRGGIGCPEWRERYLHRQSMINAYARKAFSGNTGSGEAENASCFCYSHPDDVRRYLRTSPCRGCGFEANCDTPCGAYLQWWDARMGWVRRKYG